MRKSVGLAILRSWVQIPGMANKISLSFKNLILPLSLQQGVNRLLRLLVVVKLIKAALWLMS